MFARVSFPSMHDFCSVLLHRSAAVEVQIPTPQEQQDQVAANECGKDTQIPPPVIEIVSQRLVELVSDFIGAILADVRCVIDKIACSAAREESIHILAARLAGRRRKGIELRRGANHGAVVKFGHHLYLCSAMLLGEASEGNLPCLQSAL